MMRTFTGIGSIAIALTASLLQAQSVPLSIDRVKQLYESAAYDEALAAIDLIVEPDAKAGAAPPKASLEYRALCLLALDRLSDAEQTIERLLTQEPGYLPDSNDASPRFVAAVNRARERVLPLLARREYDGARRAFDEKRNTAAAEGFARAVALLDNPAIRWSPAASGDDLRTLAAGFLELTRAANAVAASAAAKSAVSNVVTIYSASDRDVTPPVTMKQDLPDWRHGTLGFVGRFEGQIDVVIDEAGNVESAMLVKSILPHYDALAVAGVRSWKYVPATKQGVPVKFRKSVAIRLAVN